MGVMYALKVPIGHQHAGTYSYYSHKFDCHHTYVLHKKISMNTSPDLNNTYVATLFVVYNGVAKQG